MGLVLDEPQEKEVIYRNDGFVLLGDGRLRDEMRTYGGLKVDFVSHPYYGSGFSVSLGGLSSSC